MQHDPEVQYLGQSGITASCLEGILLFVEGAERFGPRDREERVYLVTHRDRHLFILPSWYGGYTVIRSGFRSEYSGEGPYGLSLAITALSLYGYIIREIMIGCSNFEKINRSKLATASSIDRIVRDQPGSRQVSRYVLPKHSEIMSKQVIHDLLTDYLGENLRFSVARLNPDLAKAIEPVLGAPIEDVLRRGFIFLESCVKKLAGVNEQMSGVRLMDQVFSDDDPWLQYSNDRNEQRACRRIFKGAFGLFRNHTAHNLTSPLQEEDQVRVLHFLDFLYRIVQNYCEKPDTSDEIHDCS